MVTGIEVTGLVLTILSLIINQLDNYVQGVETIKSFRTKRYRRYLDKNLAILGGQYAILINCLEMILEDTVPEDQISRLLANTRDPLWTDLGLQRQLQQRLGRGYTPFCDIMSQVSHTLEELASKMGLPIDISSTQGQPVVTLRGLHKIKDILSKSIYKELFDNLDNLNNIVRTLVDQSVTRNTRQRLKTKSRESTRRYKSIRQTTASLYETLMNKTYWQCSCFDTHSIYFVLDKDINVCDRLEVDRLRLVLMTTPRTAALSKWHEIESKTAQTQVTSAVSTSSIMTRSRSVRFASPPVAPTAYTDPGTGSSNRPSSKISNICHAVYGCSSPNGQGVVPIGHLSDGQYTHDFQILNADTGTLELLSLEELLLASLSATGTFRAPLIFPKRERRFLAAKLASTFLECHGNWLPPRWSSRNILFPKNITSTNLEKAIQTPVLARKIFNPTDFEGYQIPWTGFNDLLFPLGLALIELSLCRTFTFLHPPSDQGQDEITALFEKARTWIYDVTCESGTKYGDAVQQCLFWTKSREVDMESEEFQAAVFQYIVKPLVEDFDQFKDL